MDCESSEYTKLHCAAFDGDLESAIECLEKDFNVNAQDKDGETPLTYASFMGYKNIVEILIHKGADVNIKNNCGHTAIFLALIRNHIEISDILILSGADLNIKNITGQTILNYMKKEIKSSLDDVIKINTRMKHALDRHNIYHEIVSVLEKAGAIE